MGQPMLLQRAQHTCFGNARSFSTKEISFKDELCKRGRIEEKNLPVNWKLLAQTHFLPIQICHATSSSLYILLGSFFLMLMTLFFT